MKKYKFEVGQTVHICGGEYEHDSIGVVEYIKTTSMLSKGGKVKNTIIYIIKKNNCIKEYSQARLFDSKHSLHKHKRNKEKSATKRAVTCAKKSLNKNEAELVKLQKLLLEAKSKGTK